MYRLCTYISVYNFVCVYVGRYIIIKIHCCLQAPHICVEVSWDMCWSHSFLPGFGFVGPTICYALMQSIGMVTEQHCGEETLGYGAPIAMVLRIYIYNICIYDNMYIYICVYIYSFIDVFINIIVLLYFFYYDYYYHYYCCY